MAPKQRLSQPSVPKALMPARQRRRPAVDASSTLSQYQQPKEAGAHKTGAKGNPGSIKNRANRSDRPVSTQAPGPASKPRPRAPPGGKAASSQAGRTALVDADEERTLCRFSALNDPTESTRFGALLQCFHHWDTYQTYKICTFHAQNAQNTLNVA